ncbi:hypothetical protein [Jiella marina]|uniref:hypothetical protein n=1 Tax=Jiella sp. LLJ827 TaxID=2917712 RepID=UPI0021008160|nr:hypothetical protein [Jiella sp. LLJ827]MCQ0990537.1 hypothetical protein [Jiella sp. LLJ827]
MIVKDIFRIYNSITLHKDIVTIKNSISELFSDISSINIASAKKSIDLAELSTNKDNELRSAINHLISAISALEMDFGREKFETQLFGLIKSVNKSKTKNDAISNVLLRSIIGIIISEIYRQIEENEISDKMLIYSKNEYNKFLDMMKEYSVRVYTEDVNIAVLSDDVSPIIKEIYKEGNHFVELNSIYIDMSGTVAHSSTRNFISLSKEGVDYIEKLIH